ncbi:MAG: cupredoxin domain-containing protein [Acidimicrobiales bacterium]
MVFSSRARGDPVTPLIDAYLGDPVVLRSLVAGTNDVHTLHVDGHWFRTEPNSPTSPPASTAHLGISERMDLAIPRAGGPQNLPGDYLYYNGRSFKLNEGSWGILRVRGPGDGRDLRPLPDRTVQRPSSSVCPSGSRPRRFAVAAVDAPLPMLGGRPGKIYALDTDVAAITSGRQPATPLVLHVQVGDCIKIELTNRMSAGAVSIHADQLAFDPADSAGVAVGREPRQAVDPGMRRTYTFYASPEVGPTTALLRDWGDVGRQPGLGLYGAVVVVPKGSVVTDPLTGHDRSSSAGWAADIRPAHGPSYRDFTLFLQDQDAGIGTHRMPYTERVDGPVGINYQATPFTGRRPEVATTPEIRAFVGDPVRIHVIAPWSEQAQVFSVENHRWPLEPESSAPIWWTRCRSEPWRRSPWPWMAVRAGPSISRASMSTGTIVSLTGRPACGAISGSDARARCRSVRSSEVPPRRAGVRNAQESGSGSPPAFRLSFSRVCSLWWRPGVAAGGGRPGARGDPGWRVRVEPSLPADWRDLSGSPQVSGRGLSRLHAPARAAQASARAAQAAQASARAAQASARAAQGGQGPVAAARRR